MTRAPEPLDALQGTLAGEHAAVWVYGVLGGQTSRSKDPKLYDAVSAAYRIHRGRRDHLIRGVVDQGGEPVVSEVGYQLPNDANTPARVRAAALVTEQRCAATYADLVARTTDVLRSWAIAALTDERSASSDSGGVPRPSPSRCGADGPPTGSRDPARPSCLRVAAQGTQFVVPTRGRRSTSATPARSGPR